MTHIIHIFYLKYCHIFVGNAPHHVLSCVCHIRHIHEHIYKYTTAIQDSYLIFRIIFHMGCSWYHYCWTGLKNHWRWHQAWGWPRVLLISWWIGPFPFPAKHSKYKDYFWLSGKKYRVKGTSFSLGIWWSKSCPKFK